MLLDLLHSNLPAFDRVALFAARTELALVNVGVAVSASLSHIGENPFEMALGASHTLVHAAERIPRLAVIKLRNVPDRLPSTQRVAILAGDIQGAVRAARVGSGRLRISGNARCAHQH